MDIEWLNKVTLVPYVKLYFSYGTFYFSYCNGYLKSSVWLYSTI